MSEPLRKLSEEEKLVLWGKAACGGHANRYGEDDDVWDSACMRCTHNFVNLRDLSERIVELENECEEWAREVRETIAEWNKLQPQIDILDNENKQLKENLKEEARLRTRLSFLLTETANALHNGPKENELWSWHDLPELSKAAIEKNNSLENELKKWKRVL